MSGKQLNKSLSILIVKFTVLGIFLFGLSGCATLFQNRNRQTPPPSSHQFPPPQNDEEVIPAVADGPAAEVIPAALPAVEVDPVRNAEEVGSPDPEVAAVPPARDPEPVTPIRVPEPERVVPEEPQGFPTSGWTCTTNMASLNQSLLNGVSGEWRLNRRIEPATARIRNFTVVRTASGLSVTAMGFTFENATVCTNRREGYYRISVQTFLGPKEFNIRLEGTSRLISYDEGEPNGTFERTRTSELAPGRTPATVAET